MENAIQIFNEHRLWIMLAVLSGILWLLGTQIKELFFEAAPPTDRKNRKKAESPVASPERAHHAPVKINPQTLLAAVNMEREQQKSGEIYAVSSEAA